MPLQVEHEKHLPFSTAVLVCSFLFPNQKYPKRANSTTLVLNMGHFVFRCLVAQVVSDLEMISGAHFASFLGSEGSDSFCLFGLVPMSTCCTDA